MPKAVESIVRGYVLLKNREALENLLVHREKLLDGLNQISGVDPNQLVAVIREEIAVIEAGLESLDGKATAAQEDDRVKVLRLTVSEGPPSIDDSASTPPPTADAADQLVQLQPAGETDVELPETQAVPGPERQNTQIRVTGLAVSVASTATAPPSAASGVVGGLDPGAFALCTPPSNEPMKQLEESKETDAHSSAFDVFRSLASLWSKESGKP